MKTKEILHTQYYSFHEFCEMMTELVEHNSCTGELSPEHISSTKVNAFRINRIYNSIHVIPELKNEIRSLKENWDWVIISESWCGDGSQNVPIIAKIAAYSNNIRLRLILRDENPEIMSKHLTNGARAIPKLICINSLTNKEIGTWGPRPAVIAEKVVALKAEYPKMLKYDFEKNLHHWYAQDKGLSLQNEFIQLVKTWKKKDN
jgi:hypothetical protein